LKNPILKIFPIFIGILIDENFLPLLKKYNSKRQEGLAFKGDFCDLILYSFFIATPLSLNEIKEGMTE